MSYFSTSCSVAIKHSKKPLTFNRGKVLDLNIRIAVFSHVLNIKTSFARFLPSVDIKFEINRLPLDVKLPFFELDSRSFDCVFLNFKDRAVLIFKLRRIGFSWFLLVRRHNLIKELVLNVVDSFRMNIFLFALDWFDLRCWWKWNLGHWCFWGHIINLFFSCIGVSNNIELWFIWDDHSFLFLSSLTWLNRFLQGTCTDSFFIKRVLIFSRSFLLLFVWFKLAIIIVLIIEVRVSRNLFQPQLALYWLQLYVFDRRLLLSSRSSNDILDAVPLIAPYFVFLDFWFGRLWGLSDNGFPVLNVLRTWSIEDWEDVVGGSVFRSIERVIRLVDGDFGVVFLLFLSNRINRV